MKNRAVEKPTEPDAGHVLNMRRSSTVTAQILLKTKLLILERHQRSAGSQHDATVATFSTPDRSQREIG